MSKSQKFDRMSVVPWANSNEWKHVFELIFGENSSRENKQEALNTIYLWKIRLNLLSSGIEGTLSILEAMLIDPETMNKRHYLTLCASSIMRFLNLCVTHRSPVKSFTRTAKSNSIPDWIINIRHDIAHSHKLPGTSILNLALFECFKWLKETYWIPEMAKIKDYIIPQSKIDTRKLFSIYSELVLLYNETNLPADFKKTLKKNGIDISNDLDRNRILKNILEIIDGHILSVNSAESTIIIEDICRSGLFERYLEDASTRNISRNFVEAVIIILAKKGLLPQLISSMSVIINDENETEVVRKSVALWMNDIFGGLSKNKDQLEKGIKPIKFEDVSNDLIKEIINLRFRIFQQLSETTEICFNSFVLLETTVGANAVKEFLSSIKTSKCDSNKDVDTTLFQNGEVVIEEQMDVEEITEVLLKPKKRWTLISDTTAFERLPLGILPPH